jgi:hypothetical protein
VAPSDKTSDRGKKALTEYDTRLTSAEDKLADRAQNAEASFKEHTAGAAARLDAAEDKLADRAQNAEAEFKKHTAGVEARLEAAEEKLAERAKKADAALSE